MGKHFLLEPCASKLTCAPIATDRAGKLDRGAVVGVGAHEATMPIDQYEDDEDKSNPQSGATLKFKEFDCPGCNANNPCDPAFGDGDEILCNYCGDQYAVRVTDEGKAKLREI